MKSNASKALDFYLNQPQSIYREMTRHTWWVVRLKQLFILLVLVPATFVAFALASYYWVTTMGPNSPDMGEPLLNLIGVFSFPILLFIFGVRPILRKLKMFMVYYIPYSAVNAKGRAVVRHYRAQRHIFGLMGCDGRKFGRVAPKSGANLFNIPYEYARECYWEHLNAGGKVSNCPKLLLASEHEPSLMGSMFDRQRVFMFQCATDVVQTEGFKSAARAASRIVRN